MSLPAKYIVQHPQQGSYESYATEYAAVEAAKALIKQYGGYAQIYQRVAMVDSAPVVTR